MINIGLVGYGGMGKVHFNNYLHIKNCKVTAICDMSEEARLAAEDSGIMAYKKIEDMLADNKFDIVDICTPTFMHKENVCKALEAGCNVICEKPLALKSEDAKDMYNLAEKKEKQLMVGQVLQFSPQMKVLKELVASKKYGEAIDASFLRLSSVPQWAKNSWLMDKNLSGLIPFDLHIHDLDIIITLFGIPDSFEMFADSRKGINYTEHYRFLYQYPSINVMAEAAWYHANYPFNASWRVYFDNAVVECTGETVTAYPYDQEPYVFDTEEKIKIPTGINLPPTDMFYEELSYFVDRVKDGQAKDQYRKEEIIALISLLEKITNTSN